jgi:hypothetical protein
MNYTDTLVTYMGNKVERSERNGIRTQGTATTFDVTLLHMAAEIDRLNSTIVDNASMVARDFERLSQRVREDGFSGSVGVPSLVADIARDTAQVDALAHAFARVFYAVTSEKWADVWHSARALSAEIG